MRPRGVRERAGVGGAPAGPAVCGGPLWRVLAGLVLWPVGEGLADPVDGGAAQAEAGEAGAGHVAQALAVVGESLAAQAGFQAAGEADQLRRAVAA
jgi:hypothetical protein